MTTSEISRCLSVDPHSAWKVASDLVAVGAIRVIGKRNGKRGGQAWNVYGVVA
jgi:hypothetical protein